MAVVVTGSSGFLGRHLVKALTVAGERVIGIDYDTVSGEGVPQKLYQVRWGQPDSFRLTLIDALRYAQGYDGQMAIVHLAANSHLPSCNDDPIGAVESNVLTTCAVLQTVCEDPDLRLRTKLIFAGSGEEYGSGMAVDEQTPLRPFNLYAGTKAAAACMIQAYTHARQLDTTIMRFATLYGPLQNKEKFVPLVINKLTNGDELVLHNRGNAMRDWVFVGDAVKCIQRAISGPFLPTFKQFRVTGERESVLHVAQEIRAALVHHNISVTGYIRTVEGGSLSNTVFMRDDPSVRRGKVTPLTTGLAITVRDYLKQL